MNKVFIGDCRDIMQTLIEKGVKVQMCVTSPPYWGLRDYGHPKQIGLEKTPEEYTLNMVEVFRLVKELLTDDGTLWLNLGDSYSGGGRGGDPKHVKADNSASSTMESYKGMPPKNLIGIPWRVAFALQADGWILRSDIIWSKPNAMPEPVTDRPTNAHEYIFLLAKKNKYYYDSNAIKEPYTEPMNRWGGNKLKATGESVWDEGTGQQTYRTRNMRPDENGRNRRSVWEINTRPCKEAHFATFPLDLIYLCILAGSRRGDIILDPFIGSGTTGEACERLGRKWIGCELNEKYEPIFKKRTAQAGLGI